MTIPAVHPPKDGSIRASIDFTLKPGWSFETRRRLFVSDAGETFSPPRQLPAGSRIVYKIPNLAKAEVATLSEPERALRRYMQVVLPKGASAGKHVEIVRAWPPVDEAHESPQVSLPRSM